MIYVYTESNNRKYKKASLEAVSYAKAIAEMANENVAAISINSDNTETLYKYGADKVLQIENDALQNFSANAMSEIINSIADGKIIVFPHSNESAVLASLLAVKKSADIITNAESLPTSLNPFTVQRKAFSGKGIMNVASNASTVIVTLLQNSFGLKEYNVSGNTETVSVTVVSSNTIVENVEKSSGKLDLKEAEIVVSAGRGMKAPENWGMIEEMATILGAATACSKPVSDIGWRPHSEHVGQTGKAIAPNLYIAIGISGAIQHLAGVNGSKKIVVINSDAEAPFFKAADYGIVGDAFEVVPKLNEALKAFKG